MHGIRRKMRQGNDNSVNRSILSVGICLLVVQWINYMFDMLVVQGFRYIDSVLYEVIALSVSMVVLCLVTQYFADDSLRILNILTGLLYSFAVINWEIFIVFSIPTLSLLLVAIPLLLSVMNSYWSLQASSNLATIFRSYIYTLSLAIIFLLNGIIVILIYPCI